MRSTGSWVLLFFFTSFSPEVHSFFNGAPKRIPITGDDILITDIHEVTGGSLLCDLQKGPQIFFLPDKTCAFRVTLSFMLPAREDTRSKYIFIGTVPALENVLFLGHSPDSCIQVLPEEMGPQGMVHVPSGKNLLVRFYETTPL